MIGLLKMGWRILKWGWLILLLFGGVAILGGWGLFFAAIGGIGQLLHRFWLGKYTERKRTRRWTDDDGGRQSEDWPEKRYHHPRGRRVAIGMMIAGYGLAVIIAFARVPSPAKLAQMRTSAMPPAWPQAQFTAPAPRVPQPPSEVVINLKGEGVVSDDVFDIDALPVGWSYRWYGPPRTRVRFEDGAEFGIADDVGVRGGKVRFSGPAGEKVTVRITPP